MIRPIIFAAILRSFDAPEETVKICNLQHVFTRQRWDCCVQALAEQLPDNRDGFSGRIPAEQGDSLDSAHYLHNIVIVLFLIRL